MNYECKCIMLKIGEGTNLKLTIFYRYQSVSIGRFVNLNKKHIFLIMLQSSIEYMGKEVCLFFFIHA